MHSNTELYLEELMRPENQVSFIKEVKRKYKELSMLREKQIDKYIYATEFIFDDVVKFLIRLEGKSNDLDADDLHTDWYDSQKFRKEMYRKHKIHISAIIKKRIKDLMKNKAAIQTGMRRYIAEQEKMTKFVKDNNEIYSKIKVRWYNIFGGPKGSIKSKGDWSKNIADGYQQILKMDWNKLVLDLFGIKYIMGVSKYTESEAANKFLGSSEWVNRHNHFLNEY